MRLLLPVAICNQKQDGSAGYGHPSCDAVLARPRTIRVLETEDLRFHAVVPFRPIRAPGAPKAVADVQVREELFAANRPESSNEFRIRELLCDDLDLILVLRAIRIRAGAVQAAGHRNRG
jgi:hypothetical protein